MKTEREVTGRVWYSLALFGVITGAFALFMWLRSSPTDDAHISFRYLSQWLRGNGLVFNPGERVEGYSNLLWIIVLAVPVFVLSGVFPGLASPGLLPRVSVGLEVALATATVALLAVGARRSASGKRWCGLAAALLVAANGTYVFWIGKGMETTFFAFLHLAFALLVLRTRETGSGRMGEGALLGFVGGAIALTRPEGVVVPVMVLAALAAGKRRPYRPFLVALAIVASTAAAQVAFRLAYYGSWLPNTYFAKSLPFGAALASGARYLVEFVTGIAQPFSLDLAGSRARQLTMALVCVTAWAAALRRWRRLWPVALQALALVGVGVALGGDWMPGFRFFVPAIPLGCLLVAEGLSVIAGESRGPRWRRVCAPLLLAVLLVAEAHSLLTVVGGRQFASWRHSIRQYGAMASGLAAHARPGSLVALSDIGVISYYNPDLRFLDVLGLADAHIASLPGRHFEKTDVDYVLARRPDYVLVMVDDWLDGKTVVPKTLFDEEFLSRPDVRMKYAPVARVEMGRGWIGGEHAMFFEVHRRMAP